jgi:mRNA-degrading endonuclease toxin of MazEF toxin-antitoxin module
MMTFQRGDVILVSIAFSGATGYKKRPAVIISTDAFNLAGTKLIVAAITSNISPRRYAVEGLECSWVTETFCRTRSTGNGGQVGCHQKARQALRRRFHTGNGGDQLHSGL